MGGRLISLALRSVSQSGLLVGWTLRIGPPRRPLVLSRMSGMFTGMSLGRFLKGLFWLLGMLPLGSSVDDFWSIWSGNAEEGLFRAYSQAGGPTGCSAFLGKGLLRIRSRRQSGDEVDVHCAQYFVNSSFAPVVCCERDP